MKFFLVLLLMLSFAFSAETVLAQSGGVDGGGGGGKMVPDQDNDGPELTTIFKEGVEFLTEGECKRAEKKFKRILKKVPRSSQANYLRGVALQCQDKHQQAVRYFKRAKRDDSSYFRAYAELGMSYLILDRPDLAREQLGNLDMMAATCGDRCPSLLLKSVSKLRTALDRIEGKTVDSDRS